MGSPVGPLFANFCMSDLEEKVLNDTDLAPSIYCRYVDDVFVDVRDVEHLHKVVEVMQQNSVLKFTYELSLEGKIPFLDVLVHNEAGRFKTTVYRKSTDTGRCLNAESECPSRYKASVIKSFIRRAIKYCSTWHELHVEFTRIKQILVNNGYSNTEIDDEIRKHLNRVSTEQGDNAKKNHILLYYRNYMSPAYKVDERVIHDIISDCVKCKSPNDRLKLEIYYQNKKTHNLILKNNPMSGGDKLKRANVVYQFFCPHEDCRLHSVSYIGSTTTSLSRRLTMHLREGSPKEHMHQRHSSKLTRKQLTENTIIIASTNAVNRLRILEALHIKDKTPSINKQIASSAVTLALWGTGGGGG